MVLLIVIHAIDKGSKKMYEQKNTSSRRNVLKTTVFGSITAMLASFSSFKLFSRNDSMPSKKLKVKIHPFAVKRNKRINPYE
jgi:hypothetical protein